MDSGRKVSDYKALNFFLLYIKLDMFSIFHLEKYSEQENFNQLIFHLLESNMHFPFTEKKKRKRNKIHLNGQMNKNVVNNDVNRVSRSYILCT